MWLLIVLLALLLRGAAPSRMSVEHFDEGVYASNRYCGALDPPYAYPLRRLYAPPVFPAVLEGVLLLSGGASRSIMWVNVVLGTLTAAAVFWIGRRWFGTTAAAAAAILAATSEYHIAFSRMALTDVPLCLCMLLGIFAGWRAMLSGRPVLILLAGGVAGLAWCTKYNGWLTLAVTGSGACGWGVFTSEPLRMRVVVLMRWAATAAVAAFCFWFVVLRDLADVGGYQAVAANHAGYFVGVAGWWAGLVLHARMHGFVDGWIAAAGAGVAVLAILLTAGPDRQDVRNGRMLTQARLIAMTVAAMSLAVLLGTGIVVGVAGLAGLGVFLLRPSRLADVPPANGNERRRPLEVASQSAAARALAAWMLLAWFAGLLVAVPLYYPYPRLSLPWLVPCWLGSGVLIQMVQAWHATQVAERGRPARTGLLCVAALGCALAAYGSVWRNEQHRLAPFSPKPLVTWADRTGLETASRQIADLARERANLHPPRPGDVAAVVSVYGEPSVFFHIASAVNERGIPVFVQPVGDLGFTAAGDNPRSVTEYVVTGPHAHRNDEPAEDVEANLTLVGRIPYRPSDLVMLDAFPMEVIRRELRADEELRVYQLRGRDAP